MKNKLVNINSNNGHFIDGNPNTGTLGTIVTAEWLNGVQERVQDVFEELRNVLLLGNLQPDGQRQNQVAEAIKAYCNNINLKVQSNTRNFDNYIPNSKKSNAVNSNSADTVATSLAAKTAYDKGVEAKRAADNANDNANGRVSKSGDTMTGNLAIRSGDYSKMELFNNAAKRLILEVIPDRISSIGNIIYRNADNNNETVIGIPRKNGTMALIGDIPVLNNTVTSNSSAEAATANAAKTAHDKGVEAKRAADNANDNANGRVSKSGDTMTGTLSIKNGEYSALHTYNTANWLAKWESAPQSAAHFAAIVQANNNGTVVNRVLMPKATGTVALEQNVVNKSGDTMTGNLIIKSGAYSRVELFNNDNKRLIIETTPDSTSSIGNIIYRNASNGNEAAIGIPRKNGVMALIEDIANTVKSAVSRSSKSRTNAFPQQTGKSYTTTGSVTVYPDGRIVQIFHLKNIKAAWFDWEESANIGDKHRVINIPLWTAMPNKIIDVSSKPIRSSSNASTFYTEAGEWISAWQIYGNDTNKSSVKINISRFRGGNDEDMDLYVVVEGY